LKLKDISESAGRSTWQEPKREASFILEPFFHLCTSHWWNR